MAGELTTTITFADGDQVTSAKLNQIISGASFTSDAVTGSTLTVTGGKLKVGTITENELGSGCVTASQLGTSSVVTSKIYDGNVTNAKLSTGAVSRSKILDGALYSEHFSTDAFATKAQAQAETAGYLMGSDNVKYAMGTAKAYGEFDITTSSRSIKSNSYNVTSLTRVDSTHTTVTLTNNMSSAFYTVVVTFVGNDTQAVGVYNKAAGSFTIVHPAESSGRAINFAVFGKY